jgi:hypothetical protein
LKDQHNPDHDHHDDRDQYAENDFASTAHSYPPLLDSTIDHPDARGA